MKRSIKAKYHFLLAVLFGIIALQIVFLLYAVGHAKNLMTLANDINSIVILFGFGIFVYMMVLYNYIPFRLHHSIKEVRSLVEEISNGNYAQLDIDSANYDQDKDIQDLIRSLEKMLGIIIRFDMAKADKIFEHHQRIQQMINLLPEAIVITNINGDVVYCNDVFRKHFPTISEMMNLNDVIWKSDYHARIAAVVVNSLRDGNNVYEVQVDDLIYLGKVLINGSIVRNQKGLSTGGVYVMSFTDNEK